MTTTVPNTKIKEVNNKVPDISGLVKSTEYEAKISYTKVKNFTISDYNEFTSGIRVMQR